jgi:TrkA-N domain/RyR domain
VNARVPATPLARVVRVLRNFWRGSVRRRWHYIRPLVLLALGLFVLIAGTIGFEQYRGSGGARTYDFFDSFYRAVTLFAFSGAVNPPVPTLLQIARIVAPILTGYAALGTIVVLSREQARVGAIRLFVRRHVIVAGLGATGSRVAMSLVDTEPVVVIERDPAHTQAPVAAAHGVHVLSGTATDEIILRRAGIANARMLVVSCGSDGANIDVAAAAAAHAGTRRSPLTIFVHLSDIDLWTSLAIEGATFGAPPTGVRLEYFNVLATGAQLMVERHPPFGAKQPGVPLRPHVLLAGIEGVGEPLVVQVARTWRSIERGPGDELRITLTGPHADADLAHLRDSYPALDRYCTLGSRQMAIESAAFGAGAAMLTDDGHCDVTTAYVCITNETDAMIAALALHARPDALDVPVTVALPDEDNGVALALTSDDGRLSRIEPFGVLAAAASSELLLRGTNELFARAQHAQWLRAQEEKGITLGQKPTMRPWDELTDAQREVNRSFADDIQHKLRMVGCMLVPLPLPDPDAPSFSFTPDELELLSKEEHVRWMDDKLANGWRYGEKRNDALKIHDQIKPWEELDEENRQWDRDAVGQLPAIIELAGFKVERRTPAGAAAPASDS